MTSAETTWDAEASSLDSAEAVALGSVAPSEAEVSSAEEDASSAVSEDEDPDAVVLEDEGSLGREGADAAEREDADSDSVASEATPEDSDSVAVASEDASEDDDSVSVASEDADADAVEPTRLLKKLDELEPLAEPAELAVEDSVAAALPVDAVSEGAANACVEPPAMPTASAAAANVPARPSIARRRGLASVSELSNAWFISCSLHNPTRHGGRIFF